MLTLMRNDYLAFSLPTVDRARLEGAAMLIVVAPRRPYSRAERAAIHDFVTQGGCLIVTTGYDDAGPRSTLLSEYGFTIGVDGPDGREPVPMGHFKSPYLRSGDKQVYVRFHAAWPVHCDDPEARVLAYGRGDLPAIVLRRVGAGKVVVVGDTHFATNANLEREDGQPFEGMRENADFWRWFLTVLRDQPAWVPPALQEGTESGSPSASPVGSGGEGTL
jgi:hypothetical protein